MKCTSLPLLCREFITLLGSAAAAWQGVAMPDIRAMCAIGRRGQVGLNGRMPWEGANARLPYDGAADRRFDPAWIVAG